MTDSTSFDVAHIGSVELLTPEFERSLWFFQDLLAMRVVAEHAGSVYLRTWDEYELYTIKLTPSDAAGVGLTTFRAISPDALARRVAAIEATGLGDGWVDGEVGTGPTYRFRDPDGHSMGIYYETERYVATDDKPALKNQASRFPGHGVNARRLDHINYLAKDVEANGEFLARALGMRESERIRNDDGKFAAWWFHFSLKSYDVVYSDDWTKHGNRLHHIAFAPDTREDILKAADIFLENGIHIESGPHKHAINQTFFLYVWEPGGNRIEFANAGARLLLDPDQPVVEWTQEERKRGQAWGMKTIETFHTHGTPLV
ncbi:VOC family protein [Microbacterium sp. cx-55]|uniref:VOC family protein n=1 Tax=Microbacterium sp. cx-55 TaxID=2875948 RepID=UPI001CBCBEE5|nr:VOC family protein [Microbacterium sp. cx-55]MBZ4488394.1 VOC family protein [Microbacterium sp. cx-55]UGB35046.1 VOC family protein [Microbacterium sp. cx-55]